MDLNTLVLFRSIVEQGSLAAAARETGVPKSTLSRKIQELEDELGVRLLQRGPRQLGLTGPGRVLLVRARSIAREAESAKRLVKAHGDEPRGPVRVTVSVSFGERVLSPLIAEFMKRYPKVTLEVFLSGKQADLVEEQIDVAVRIGRPDPKGALIAKRIAQTSHYLCAASSYVDRRGRPEVPEDLSSHDAIVYRGGTSEDRWELESDTGEPVSIALRPIFVANSYPMAMDLIEAGLGVGLVPALFCGEKIQNGTLLHLLPRFRSPYLWVYAAFPSREHQSLAVRAFIDFVADKLNHPYWVLEAS